jgi:hypothetical protein
MRLSIFSCKLRICQQFPQADCILSRVRARAGKPGANGTTMKGRPHYGFNIGKREGKSAA